jgi:hypothetical protein
VLPTDPTKPYPTDLVLLYMEWMQHDVSSTQASECFSATLRYFGCAEEKVCVPGQQRASRWRQALGAVAYLHSAIILARCVSYTLCNDMGSMKHLKLGTCALRCVMPGGEIVVVALGGMFSQAGGTAEESLKQIVAVFNQAEELLADSKKSLEKQGLDHSWIPHVEPGTLGREVSACSQADHANAATLTNTLLRKSFKLLVHSVGCQDHARNLLATAATAASDVLNKGLLDVKEPEEFNDSDELTSTFLRELYIQFHDPTYAFGDQADLKIWTKKEYPGQLVQMLRLIGNRFDVFVENAGIALHNLDYYVKRLLFTKAAGKELNALERKILKKAGNVRLLADLRTQSILFFTLLQPYRTVANSKEMNKTYLQMARYVQIMETLLERCCIEGFEGLLGEDFFADAELKVHTDKYRSKHPEAWKAAQTSHPDVPELFERELQKTMAEAVLEKLRKICGPLCKDGKYANPTPEVIAEMASVPPTNRLAESCVGLYKFIARAIVNASHFTYSGLVAAKLNHTCQWLRSTLPSTAVMYGIVAWGRNQGPKLAVADRLKLEVEEEINLAKDKEKQTKRVALARLRRVGHAVLALRAKEEHATTTGALKEGMCALEAKCKAAGRTEKQTADELRKYQRLQIDLWKRKGLPKRLIPIASCKDPNNPGKRMDHPVSLMTEKLEAAIAQVSSDPTLLVPVMRDSSLSFLDSLSYRGAAATGVVQALLEGEATVRRQEQAAIDEEAAQLYGEENTAREKRLEVIAESSSEELTDDEEQSSDKTSSGESDEASGDESDEASGDESDNSEEKGDEDTAAEEGDDVGVGETWQAALPEGAQLLSRPRTWKSMKDKHMVLCGHTAWFVGKIAKVERAGLVTMRVDGESVYQELDPALYGTAEEIQPGMWSLFRTIRPKHATT